MGVLQYTEVYKVPWRDIKIHFWDTISAVKGIRYIRGYHEYFAGNLRILGTLAGYQNSRWGYHQYNEGVSSTLETSWVF